MGSLSSVDWLAGHSVAAGTGLSISRHLCESFLADSSGISHLAGRDELQRAEGDLEVGGVALEVVQSLGDALLELGGVGPRGAVGGDLVQRGAHFGGWLGLVGRGGRVS